MRCESRLKSSRNVISYYGYFKYQGWQPKWHLLYEYSYADDASTKRQGKGSLESLILPSNLLLGFNINYKIKPTFQSLVSFNISILYEPLSNTVLCIMPHIKDRKREWKLLHFTLYILYIYIYTTRSCIYIGRFYMLTSCRVLLISTLTPRFYSPPFSFRTLLRFVNFLTHTHTINTNKRLS